MEEIINFLEDNKTTILKAIKYSGVILGDQFNAHSKRFEKAEFLDFLPELFKDDFVSTNNKSGDSEDIDLIFRNNYKLSSKSRIDFSKSSFQRPHKNNSHKITKPANIQIKNYLSNKSADDHFQNANYILLYFGNIFKNPGLGVIQANNLQPKETNNDQITVSVENDEWEYCKIEDVEIDEEFADAAKSFLFETKWLKVVKNQMCRFVKNEIDIYEAHSFFEEVISTCERYNIGG